MAKKGAGDPAMEKARALFRASGLSLVELGRRMGYPEETARQAAWQFMRTADPRVGTLRKFAKAMDVRLDELLPRRKRMARKLEVELDEAGCELTGVQFRELIEERKATTSPTWSIDDLVCHPDDAKEFCRVVRAETKCPNLSDFLILRTLQNVRRDH